MIACGRTGLAMGLMSVLGMAAPAGAATHFVLVGDIPGQFTPADVVVELGDTVQWDWVGGIHNVESGVGPVHDGNFRSGDAVPSPNSYAVTFDQAFLDANPTPGDVYPYYCIVHYAAGMVGSVTVVQPPVPTVSEWGMIVLAGLIVLGAGMVLRRRGIATA